METSSGTIVTTNDVDSLAQMIRPVEGHYCASAAISYGGELVVDFGDQPPSPHKGEHFRHPWVLGTSGSDWTIAVAGDTIASSAEYEMNLSLGEKVHLLDGRRLISIALAPSLDLVLRFDGSAEVRTRRAASEPGDPPDVPDWEMFLPHGMVLRIGPGDRWWYGDEDDH